MQLDVATLTTALLPTAALIGLVWALRRRFRFTQTF